MVTRLSKKKDATTLPLRQPSKSSKGQKRTRRIMQMSMLSVVVFGLICILLITVLMKGAIDIPFDKGNLFPNSGSLNIRHNNARISSTALSYHEKELKDPPPSPPSHPCDGFNPPSSPPNKKHTGPRSCDVCYISTDEVEKYKPAFPSVSSVLKNLTFAYEKRQSIGRKVEARSGGSLFGGYHSLKQREIYFDIVTSMIVPCGFFQGKNPGRNTGFDINLTDLLEMEECRGVVVISAIFGNFDVMQQPENINELSKRKVCFYMFVDEETAPYILVDKEKKAGLWRVVVVLNLPYVDPRRNGKIPKLLSHRLFPNAENFIWIDGKLKLVRDPYQILERHLWRESATFAISNHYRRFDVFEEAEANKVAGKYENASIDRQIEFYTKEGLTHYSSTKLPIISDVPEGSVIIREHNPITNLFTCAWFNEVDRFTSRDQISYSTVRDKIIVQDKSFKINMFKDCERRNFVIQSYHKDLLERRNSSLSSKSPSSLTRNITTKEENSVILRNITPKNSVTLKNMTAEDPKYPTTKKIIRRKNITTKEETPLIIRNITAKDQKSLTTKKMLRRRKITSRGGEYKKSKFKTSKFSGNYVLF